MKLFEHLSSINPDADLTIRIMGKNGQFTVYIKPSVKEANIIPLVITGTAAELDEEFVQKISAPLKQAGLVIQNLSEYQESLKEAEKEGKKEPEKKSTPVAATKAAPTKKASPAKKSPSSKPTKPKKSATPKTDRHEPEVEIQEAGGGEVETQEPTEPEVKSGEASLF